MTTKAIEQVQRDQGFRPEESRGLFVGVNEFDEQELTLHFAVDDAVDLAFLFSCELGLIPPERVYLALSGSPTKPKTADQLSWLRNHGATIGTAAYTALHRLLRELAGATGAGGLWVVSFSTHGFNEGGGDYIAVRDSIQQTPRETCLAFNTVLNYVSQAKAQRQLLLLDTCRSRLGTGTRILGDTRGTRMTESLAQAIAKVTGLAVLLSTTLGGSSYEHPQLQNGVFTHAILRGLQGKAPVDRAGFVTVRTLGQYVDEEVAAWVQANRKNDIGRSRGITVQVDVQTLDLPLASTAPEDVSNQEFRSLRERAPVRLQQNLGRVITGRHLDEINSFVQSEPRAKTMPLLREIAELDGSEKAQRSVLYTFEQLRQAVRSEPLEPVVGRWREHFRCGFEQMYGLTGAVDLAGAQASFREAAATEEVIPRVWLAWLHTEGQCLLPSNPEAGRSLLRRNDLAALETSAASGDVAAALVIGFALIDGIGVTKDPKRARAFLTQAARAGDTVAMNCLGYLLDSDDRPAADRREALQWFRQAAQEGNATAMHNLAYHYETGREVESDVNAALSWYQQAADRGLPRALNRLGHLYENGIGGPPDPQQAAVLYRRAAERGWVEAMANLGCLLADKNGSKAQVDEGLLWLRRAVERDNFFAMRYLGAVYADGDVVAKDTTQALALWTQAAERGDVRAMETLGDFYKSDREIGPNPALAVSWYRRAIEGGSVEAMVALAQMYAAGTSVQQDLNEARRLYSHAAARGSHEAMYGLGSVIDSQTATPKSQQEAFNWYLMAAQGGHRLAMDIVGMRYQSGRGAAQDYSKAHQWYLAAANTGLANSMNNLGFLYEYGLGVGIDRNSAVSWYRKAADGGSAYGMYNLGRAYKSGFGVPEDLQLARKWLQAAIDHGHPAASEVLRDTPLRDGLSDKLAQLWTKLTG